MLYRHAEPSDRAGLHALWAQCFRDSDKLIASYFDAYGTKNALVAAQDGSISAMGLYFPAELVLQDGETVSAAYLYCVCTAPAQRGRGLATGLLQFAHGELKKQGFACAMLVPAQEELFDYYRRLGYETAFTYSRSHWQLLGVKAAVKPVSTDRYRQLRQMLLWENFVLHSAQDIAFCKTLCRLCGGDLLEISTDGELSCAAVQRGENGLKIFDLLSEQAEPAIAAILAYYHADSAEVLRPGTTPYGMVKWLGKAQPLHNAYLGLSME